jgi:hypothetical protein
MCTYTLCHVYYDQSSLYTYNYNHHSDALDEVALENTAVNELFSDMRRNFGLVPHPVDSFFFPSPPNGNHMMTVSTPSANWNKFHIPTTASSNPESVPFFTPIPLVLNGPLYYGMAFVPVTSSQKKRKMCDEEKKDDRLRNRTVLDSMVPCLVEEEGEREHLFSAKRVRVAGDELAPNFHPSLELLGPGEPIAVGVELPDLVNLNDCHSFDFSEF